MINGGSGHGIFINNDPTYLTVVLNYIDILSAYPVVNCMCRAEVAITTYLEGRPSLN